MSNKLSNLIKLYGSPDGQNILAWYKRYSEALYNLAKELENNLERIDVFYNREIASKDKVIAKLQSQIAEYQSADKDDLPFLVKELRRVKRNKRRAKGPSPMDAYGLAQLRATERGKSWDISKVEYYNLVSKPCNYCGEPLGNNGIRLDRLDNTLGYSPGNVVPCCYRCNMTRGNRLTPSQMMEIGKQLRQ